MKTEFATKLTQTKKTTDEGARATELAALVESSFKAACRRPDRYPALEELVPLYSSALDATKEIKDERARATALNGIGRNLGTVLERNHLPSGFRSEALELARGISDLDTRATALSGLAPNEALQTIKAITNDNARASALIQLGQHLKYNSEVTPAALNAAIDIKDESARARALVGLAPHLVKAQSEEAADGLTTQALEAATGIENERARGRALIGLAPHLTQSQQGAARAASMARKFEKQFEEMKGYTGTGQRTAMQGELERLKGHDAVAERWKQTASQAANNISDPELRKSAIKGLNPLSKENREDRVTDVRQRSSTLKPSLGSQSRSTQDLLLRQNDFNSQNGQNGPNEVNRQHNDVKRGVRK